MTTGTYRRRVSDVRAVQWTGDNLAEVHAEFGEQGIAVLLTEDGPTLHLVTIQGRTVPCGRGEWVLAERVPGRFYPVAADVFADTYDRVGP